MQELISDTMIETVVNLFKKPLCTDTNLQQDTGRSGDDITDTGIALQQEISRLFGRSLAIREVDCGSDNAAEIELGNLSSPFYDLERFGITFVASPRHADALMVTGAVTLAMADALRKTYDATPDPKIVIAVGDDACTGGIWKGSYAVLGGVDAVIPVNLKIPGNPPSPAVITRSLLTLLRSRRYQ
ncbi:NADH-quinone oxidoreductase subunit B family protein [uncultured Methanospirillum sp.]|uniref:NADH-quinone oxidoreductase subunit B family protein n=1 Tax=uncultured Methanospirillum sp. TaxID=262503 RepID=UPI0029C85345|nr:NADH-quinone oxidoreductase subunit B family protein [uncultured Methanospirillum sp.]